MTYTPEAKAFARAIATAIENDKIITTLDWDMLLKLLKK